MFICKDWLVNGGLLYLQCQTTPVVSLAATTNTAKPSITEYGITSSHWIQSCNVCG